MIRLYKPAHWVIATDDEIAHPEKDLCGIMQGESGGANIQYACCDCDDPRPFDIQARCQCGIVRMCANCGFWILVEDNQESLSSLE